VRPVICRVERSISVRIEIAASPANPPSPQAPRAWPDKLRAQRELRPFYSAHGLWGHCMPEKNAGESVNLGLGQRILFRHRAPTQLRKAKVRPVTHTRMCARLRPDYQPPLCLSASSSR
jgi:hypothetical protein